MYVNIKDYLFVFIQYSIALHWMLKAFEFVEDPDYNTRFIVVILSVVLIIHSSTLSDDSNF